MWGAPVIEDDNRRPFYVRDGYQDSSRPHRFSITPSLA